MNKKLLIQHAFTLTDGDVSSTINERNENVLIKYKRWQSDKLAKNPRSPRSLISNGPKLFPIHIIFIFGIEKKLKKFPPPVSFGSTFKKTKGAGILSVFFWQLTIYNCPECYSFCHRFYQWYFYQLFHLLLHCNLKVVGNEKWGGSRGWLLVEIVTGPWRSMSVCFFMQRLSFLLHISVSCL